MLSIRNIRFSAWNSSRKIWLRELEKREKWREANDLNSKWKRYIVWSGALYKRKLSSHPITTMSFIWGKEVGEGEKSIFLRATRQFIDYGFWTILLPLFLRFTPSYLLDGLFYRHFIWSNVKRIRFYSHFPYDLSNVRFLPPNTQGFEFWRRNLTTRCRRRRLSLFCFLRALS